ncbi:MULTISPECIES: hypothetical protein [unclassified Bacillus cereus group]|uniref:hypothetical protein n=1 Tax=unclassified Bacillus cereus group TaxID=2750818 RepID=UPI0029C14B59|nr:MULTISPECIES: hypothetical protein [unclassified Bacillus cereus group]MDX5880826.1 hypothetical protein [Bacillus cereus group sp. BfR-BA-01042]MDX5906680.1 hypothetical protein [Bacillus cereus group sp. BfR-BA-01048]
MSKKIYEQTFMEYLKEQGKENEFKEFMKKKEEEANDPNVMTVKQVADEMNEYFKKGNWNIQKVRRYIRENKLKTMNKEVVEKEKNSRIGYRIDRKEFYRLRSFEEKTKWDLKVDLDKLLDENKGLKDKIKELNDEIKRLKEEEETK